MLLSDETITELSTPARDNYSFTKSKDIEDFTSVEFNSNKIIVPKRDKEHNPLPMITPFIDKSVSTDTDGKKIPSYGLSSYGYDIRLEPEFKIFNKPNDGRIIDVLDYDDNKYCNYEKGDRVVIPPGGLALSYSVEWFNMPRTVTGLAVGKSTWARIGAIVNITPLEAEWSGKLVVEITNGTNLPMYIYAGVGIAQILFIEGDRSCLTSYANGKYDNQTDLQSSKV